MGTAAGMPPSTGPNGGVTFEEIEQQLKDHEKQLEKPDLSKIVLNDEAIPENLRGKSVQEMLAHARSVEEALRLSEQGRQQALILAQTASQRGGDAPKPEPAQPPEPQVTAEQVAAAFQEDPAKGVELMQRMNEQAITRAAQQFSARLEPMMAGAVSAVEAEARRRYPDEFELYKEEIKEVLGQLPDKRVMSTDRSWDDMVAYVRGKNPMKLFDHLNTKEAAKRAREAQEAQVAGIGFQSTGGSRPPAAPTGPAMDATTEEICRVMGLTKEEYIKWSRVS